MSDYFYLDDNREPQGPHTLAELARLRKIGTISDKTLVAQSGDDSWQPIGVLLRNASAPEAPTATSQASAKLPPSGTCPTCGHPAELDTNGALPEHCPACHRRWRVANGGLLTNFGAALAQYATFSGRATRMEFWSFIILSNAIMFLFELLLLWPLLQLLETIQEGLEPVGGFIRLTQLPEETQRVVMEHLEALLREELCSPELLATFTIGGLGLLISTIAFLLPTLAVTSRRLHDAGRSGWWLGSWFLITFAVPFALIPLGFASLLLMGPAAGALVTSSMNWILLMASLGIALLIFILCFFDSQRGANAYGPSAKYPRA